MSLELAIVSGLIIVITVAWMLGIPSVLSQTLRFAYQKVVSHKTSETTAVRAIGFSLWFRLFLATALGSGMGLFMSYISTYIVGLDPFEGLGSFLFGGLWGAFMGALQYRVLRDYLPRANRWIWACVIGWALGIGLSINLAIFISETSIALFTLPIVGAAVGLVQWFLLKQIRLHAIWWIPINSLGWMASLAIGWWVSYPILTREGDVVPFVLSPWAIGMATGVVSGVFTATAMIWLLHQPPFSTIIQKDAG